MLNLGTRLKRSDDSSPDKRDRGKECFQAPLAPIKPAETMVWRIDVPWMFHTTYGAAPAEPGDLLYSCKDGRIFVVPGPTNGPTD